MTNRISALVTKLISLFLLMIITESMADEALENAIHEDYHYR